MFESSAPQFRLEVTCDGAQPTTTSAIEQLARQQLKDHLAKVRLANVRVERSKARTHVCHVQLFGHGLAHVGGHSEHAELEAAVSAATHRAVRALDAEDRFDPWTSEPPSSHRL